jgi:hypothetical protein
MEIGNSKVVPDIQVYRTCGISTDYGRKVLDELERRGEIEPKRTSTGRSFLSFEDTERLAQSLSV